MSSPLIDQTTRPDASTSTSRFCPPITVPPPSVRTNENGRKSSAYSRRSAPSAAYSRTARADSSATRKWPSFSWRAWRMQLCPGVFFTRIFRTDPPLAS